MLRTNLLKIQDVQFLYARLAFCLHKLIGEDDEYKKRKKSKTLCQILHLKYVSWSLKFLVFGLIEHFINHDQSKEVPFNYKRVDLCARVILMDVTLTSIQRL